MYLIKHYELGFTTEVFLFSHFLYLPPFYSFISLQRLLWQCAKYEMYAYNVFFCCRKNMFFVLANES